MGYVFPETPFTIKTRMWLLRWRLPGLLYKELSKRLYPIYCTEDVYGKVHFGIVKEIPKG